MIKKFFVTSIMLLSLMACSSEETITKTKLHTVQKENAVHALFYSGTISPLKTVVIISPAEGTIIDMPFQYGEPIKINQRLFVLSSSKFLTDYKAALLQYVKAKNDFNQSQTQFKEAEFLYKNELISADDYKMRQSHFYGNQLALLQAKDSLENLLRPIDNKETDLNKLSIADIKNITQAMHLQKNTENLQVFSPAKGIVLAANKNDEEHKKINQGDVVKQGDVLAMIGDLSGLSVRIKVNELVVTQLKIGQNVKVTGIAFPDEILKGSIVRIDRQGETTNNGLPTFFVEVAVPTLTALQQKKIHVGMSAKIEIEINEAPQIFIPITALKEKNGLTYVNVYDPEKQNLQWREVKTGKTTLNSVTILSGLNAGDKIATVS